MDDSKKDSLSLWGAVSMGTGVMIGAVKANPRAFDGKLILMHCPMVYEDRGASWLQASEPLQNPYFGSSMLKCGEIIEHLGEQSD